jgi:uncharacterized protein (TIGR03435 family)
MMKRPAFSTVVLFIVAGIAASQTSTRLQFEVASVKEDPAFTGTSQGIGSPSPGTLRGRGVPLRLLCRIAYEIDTFNIFGGPKWIDSKGFNIDAKAPVVPGESRADEMQRMRSMLQSLLEDRFRLKAHFETREMPIYVLTIAKSGLKMKPAPCDPVETPCLAKLREAMLTWPTPISGAWMPVSRFLIGLATYTNGQRAIVDKTGLTGLWDMHMQWAYQPPPSASNAAVPSEPAGIEGESIFTALERQLGLHLESSKGPVKVLVIDHAEKPGPN